MAKLAMKDSKKLFQSKYLLLVKVVEYVISKPLYVYERNLTKPASFVIRVFLDTLMNYVL